MGAAALGWPTLLLALLPPCTFSGIADFTGAAGAGVLWSTSPDPPPPQPPRGVCVRGWGLGGGFPWGQPPGLVVQVTASFLPVNSCYSSTQWSTGTSPNGTI